MTKKQKSPFNESIIEELVKTCSTQEDLMDTFKKLQKAVRNAPQKVDHL